MPITHPCQVVLVVADEVVVLRQGGRIAQAGSPTEILAAPADDFVREFVGADRADRRLVARHVAGRRVVDGGGRPVGVLTL